MALAVTNGVPAPGMMASLSYFDTYRRERLPANLVQVRVTLRRTARLRARYRALCHQHVLFSFVCFVVQAQPLEVAVLCCSLFILSATHAFIISCMPQLLFHHVCMPLYFCTRRRSATSSPRTPTSAHLLHVLHPYLLAIVKHLT